MNKEEFKECSVVAYPRQIKFLHINGGAISYYVDRHVSDYVDRLQQENQELKLELSGYRQAILKEKEMLGLKEENDKLKKQLKNYKKLGFKYLQDKNNNLEAQQKEFIKYLEDGIDICDGFLDTVKSDLQEIPYGVISTNENITTQIKENETAHKVYEEILKKYKKIIGDGK